jgi:hypothetical protein
MKLKHNEFSTTIPESWEDRTMITIVAPFDAGQFASNVVITRHFVQAHESLEDFVLEQLKIMRDSLPNFELLDSRTDTLNDRPSCRQLHRFQTENGYLQQVQTFVLANRSVYAITGTSTITDFDRHVAAFREIVENFEVEDED